MQPNYKWTLLFILLIGTCLITGCPDDGDTEKDIYSCRYHNTFAGPDCKEYIGPKWDDVAEMESNCGDLFLEENAVLVNESCPSTMEENGENFTLIGYCQVDIGGEEEHTVYSYDGILQALIDACSNFQSGDWTTVDENGGKEVVLHLPMPEAFLALSSTAEVEVSSGCSPEETDDVCLLDMIVQNETFDYTPIGQEVKAGVVFYPGGNVDPRAYAPSAVALAEQGLFVSVVAMENYLALNGPMRADDVRALHPAIDKWFIAGHSLGGTIAVQYAATDSGDTLDGVIIWDSIPNPETDISESDLSVLLLHTTENQLTTQELVDAHKQYLPPEPQTVYYKIEGGNHSQFAYYESPKYPATITREAQQTIIIEQTVNFVEDVIITP